MSDQFVKRVLRVIIGIAGGQDGEHVAETYTLENHRVSVVIENHGEESQGEMNCRIFGVSLELMNKLTAIGPVMNQIRNKNKIQIDAGNEGDQLYTIYAGTIDTCYGDMNQAPDVALTIRALSALGESLKPAIDTPYSAPVPIVQAMSHFAHQMGFSFAANDVTGNLPIMTFRGGWLDQVKECARAADINFSIENRTLNIWKRAGWINEAAQDLSPSTGMVGYPTFSSAGMIVKSLFLPHSRIGGRVKITDSDITQANGTWGIYQVVHELDSIVQNGKWFTTLGVQTRYA